MKTHAVRGVELKVGHVILFLERPYAITLIKPHPNPIVDGSRIAYSGDWSITINPDDIFEIVEVGS